MSSWEVIRDFIRQALMDQEMGGGMGGWAGARERDEGREGVARRGGGRERKLNTYSDSCVTRFRLVWILSNFVPNNYASPTS